MSEFFGSSRQAAVVAIAGGKVCLVTSRGGRRWTLPKGTVEADQTEAETAGREVWEEAGLSGNLEAAPLLRYEAEKSGRTSTVAVFLMWVGRTASDWPERSLRTRRWFSPEEAIEFLTVAGQREAVQLAAEFISLPT